MEYVTVYVTGEKEKINLLKIHFEKDNLDFRMNRRSTTDKSEEEVAFEVAEKDRERAREILHETGYLKIDATHGHAQNNWPERKLVPLVLAGIILVLVIITVWWFMNSAAE